jgi:hypothetical protein
VRFRDEPKIEPTNDFVKFQEREKENKTLSKSDKQHQQLCDSKVPFGERQMKIAFREIRELKLTNHAHASLTALVPFICH